MEMKSARRTPARVPTETRRGKHILPAPRFAGAWVLAIECFRQRNPSIPGVAVLHVLTTHDLEMLRQAWPHSIREQRDSVLPPLALPNHNPAMLNIHVLDPQLERFLEPQAGAVAQCHDEPRRTVETCEDCRKFSSTQRDRQPPRRRRPHDTVDCPDLERQHNSMEAVDPVTDSATSSKRD